MEKRNVPKLRFPGFEGIWEEKTLGEVSIKINSGKTPLGGEKVYTAEGVTFIRSQNIFDDQLDLNNQTFISQKTNEEMKNSIVKAKDILLNITGASLGRSCVVPENFEVGNVNQHVCIIRLKEGYSPKFIQPILSSTKGQNLFESLQTGSGREGLNFQSIKGIKILLPAREEQFKIAKTLDSLSTKISILKKKKALLEKYKKGMMQKIFNQEIRFKDEDGKEFGEWEERKLNDIAIKQSSNVSANKIEDNVGDYVIYGASGVLKMVDFYQEENDYISIVKDGAGVGRLFYCKGFSSVLGTMDIIKPIEGINTYFLYCLLGNIDFNQYVSGSTIPHIYFKNYANEICSIPTLTEQIKIANFLSAIDDKINLVAVQIEKMEMWKKGLLGEMFV